MGIPARHASLYTILGLILLAVQHSARADLYITGNLGLRSQQIDRDGGSNSPLSGVEKNHFATGNVISEWEIAPYQTMTGQLDISAQRSDLAEPRDNVRVNRASLTYENGRGVTPYRASAGDIYTLYSPRLLRRNLKGAQLDLQPNADVSIQMVAGLNSAAWNQGGYADRYSGASWLQKTRSLGDFSLNFVFSEDQDHANEQRTASFGWFKSVQSSHHQLDMEVELLHHNTTAEDGKGVYIESGARLFDNRTRFNLTFERYDEFFQPRGAVTGAGQKRWLASLSQQLGRSFINLDFTDFDSVTSDNREKAYNLNYSVNFDSGVIANLSASDRHQTGFGNSTRTDTQGIQLSYAIGVNHGIEAGWQGVDSKSRFSSGKSHSRSSDWSLGWRSSGALGGGTWHFAPRFVWRDLDSSNLDSREFAPSLSTGFRHDRHDLKLHYGASFREADPTFSVEDRRNRNRRVSVSYGYRVNNTQWRLEAGRFASHSNITDDQQEDSVVLSVEQRFSVDGRGRSTLQPTHVSHGVIDPIYALSQLVASGEYALAQDIARSTNPGSQQQLAEQSRYRGYFVDGAHQSQELILHRNGRFLGEAHLLIDLSGLDGARAQRLFDTLKAYLYSRFGSPVQERFNGQFDSSLQQGIQSGQLVRVMEWELGGKTLRFGLPPSLDGQPKLQISLKAAFGSALEGYWNG